MKWEECYHIKIWFTEDPDPETKDFIEFKKFKGVDKTQLVKYRLDPSIIVIKTTAGKGTYIYPYRIIRKIAIYSDKD